MLRRVIFVAFSLICAETDSWAADKPRPLAEAAAHIQVPAGFEVALFAGEPDVVQPIACCLDDRGRLWVVESMAYPTWDKALKGQDRVVILEDTDGDGRCDRRKIFWDQGSNLSGIELGFGGVWLCSTPQLVFVPDANGDDQPDGAPQVVLDGWDLNARHNVFNGLTWGPDGWLYGLNGILSESNVGRPGAAETERTRLNCGVWRYHPTRRAFQVVASGTTNPWGLDFDDHGRMFITNCVIKHLFHVIPGGHYERMFGQDLNRHAYALLSSCADHIHWGGGDWTTSRGGHGVHDQPGGGHAHAGAMIYLGDNWPAEYRNRLFTCNIHGSRVNQDLLEPHGSGFVAKHAADFLRADDEWFRGLELLYGPDGGVYLTDWSDTGECHDYDHVHRESGRIYKITYGKPSVANRDLAALSDAELVELQAHRNDWHVRHARRLLQERAAAGRLDPSVPTSLLDAVRKPQTAARQLRALWALYAVGGWNETLSAEFLAHPAEHVRAWAVQLELDDDQATESTRQRLAKLARDDGSPVVRLSLASGLQRLPVAERHEIAAGLLGHAGDAEDDNLPLMIWYGLEPALAADPSRGLALVSQATIPLVRELAARRIAADRDADVQPLVALLKRNSNPELRRDVLAGMYASLVGKRDAKMPAGWSEVAAEMVRRGELRQTTLALSVLFGDPQAVVALEALAADSKTPLADREAALQTLLQRKSASIQALCKLLLADPGMRGPAIRALAAFADPEIPSLLLEDYPGLAAAERADVVNTLAGRPEFALALLAAVERKVVSRGDLSAFTVRQMAGLKSSAVDQRLKEVWGEIRPPTAEKAAQLAKLKSLLTPDALQQADLAQGRQVFQRTCAGCHKLFDAGNSVGPELTGSQRSNLDYLLENLLDPSAAVGRDYLLTVIVTEEGRVINGIVKVENENSITLQTPNDTVLIPKEEVAERVVQRVSLMPEDLLGKLREDEVRDLFRYLGNPRQVPLAP